MSQKIETTLSCKLEISSELPPDFPGSRITERPICTYTFPFGYLTIQEIVSQDYILTYHVTRSSVLFPYKSHLPAYPYFLVIVLQGEIDIQAEDRTGQTIRYSQWSIFQQMASLPLVNSGIGDAQVIFLHFRGKQLEELENLFPGLLATISTPDKQPSPQYLPLDAREYAQNILYCKFETDWRKHFIDHRVDDILFSILVNSSGSNPIQEISQEDLEKIRQAEQIIREDITRHKSLRLLAEEIGMSLTKFKQLFKKVYQQTPAEYQRKLRLKLAVDILHLGYSVKESAYKSGWRPAVFIEAFREVYDITPGKYIKQRGRPKG